jgi:hypothetical protein
MISESLRTRTEPKKRTPKSLPIRTSRASPCVSPRSSGPRRKGQASSSHSPITTTTSASTPHTHRHRPPQRRGDCLSAERFCMKIPG